LSNSLFLFPLDLTSVDRRSEIWSLQSSQSSYLSTISSTSNSSLRLSLYHRILEPLVSKGQVYLLCQMEVESIILQEVRSSAASRPYRAVGVIARNILTQGRHFFAPESDGEIVLSSGSLSSPQLLLNSIILPEGYSLSSLHDSFNTSEVAQYLVAFVFEPLRHPRQLLSPLRSLETSPSQASANRSLTTPFCSSFASGIGGTAPRLWLPLSSDSSSAIPNPIPPNCVHGWIFLNERGDVYNPLEDSSSPPKSVSHTLSSPSCLCLTTSTLSQIPAGLCRWSSALWQHVW
jgi:hypothetical protein